jgi:2-polyprenyl-3-methyl-5-hydroxy-6-metoxy-1,4-benzoquinol methylase
MSSTLAYNLISSRFSYKQTPSFIFATYESQYPAIDLVRSKIESGEYKLVASPCPCGAESCDTLVAETDRYGLPLLSKLCMGCGTVRLDPYLDQSSLEDFYTNHYQKMYGRLEDINAYFNKQLAYGRKILDVAKKSLAPGSLVFEVGCGAGGALKLFQDSGYRVAGCDFSSRAIEESQKRGITTTFQGSPEDLTSELRPDLIFLHHVFEHLIEPVEFLRRCNEKLSSAGRIIVVVPDISRIHRYPNPAGNLLIFLHIAHKYNFSFEGLARLAARAGFKATQLTPDHSIKTTGSTMPELWVEFSPLSDSAEKEQVKLDAGHKMLSYLQRTERLHSLGLCPDQIRSRINSLLIFRAFKKARRLLK